MQPEFLSMLETELGVGRVGQEYGMTEIGNFLTCNLDVDHDDDRRHTSIGRCLPHMEIKIVDNNGTVVPIGAEGEIWARGYSIMSCYDNDRERTAEMITDDRWLRTGDLARMDDDGYLFFVGRKKEMIIRGSTNIYPMEIERVILEHPSVADVQVFSIPDPLIDEAVCAFVKLKPEMKCEVDELKMFLSDKLTPYKIPEHIRFVDDFTRNVMGKVAKYKLAEEMIHILKSS
ncbi:unnamed protein product [Rotaria sp. Silwood1]|nr:unnamed protein product [Rotaria sp. Silwood1]CAF1537620.1 unnamed protein product [Rotaria sp. Silwood1]CAF1539919.1 unnamed protein product [Rotaria sp. Silwood1]CAF3633459.1 unnamed protein product [Rotaria sp. Silwood1]CAF3637417.1 unnamed protein product [Rotaria sp. Silwood1]